MNEVKLLIVINQRLTNFSCFIAPPKKQKTMCRGYLLKLKNKDILAVYKSSQRTH